MNIQKITQSAKYDVSCLEDLRHKNHYHLQVKTLLGSLGGALSLYLGCAMVGETFIRNLSMV